MESQTKVLTFGKASNNSLLSYCSNISDAECSFIDLILTPQPLTSQPL